MSVLGGYGALMRCARFPEMEVGVGLKKYGPLRPIERHDPVPSSVDPQADRLSVWGCLAGNIQSRADLPRCEVDVAGNDPQVARLGYMVAFAPDPGESVSTLIANSSPSAPVPPVPASTA